MKFSLNSTVLLCFKPDQILMTKDYCYNSKFKDKKVEIMKQNRSTVYNGFIGPSAGRKLKKIISCWSECIDVENSTNKNNSIEFQRKLIFITLTLSSNQRHDDLFLKRKLLNRFLLLIQSKYDVRHYIWKAEKQMNGRLHFHIIIDRFISKFDIQREWNVIQDSFGYLDDYKAKFQKNNPPSTHVEAYDSSEQARDYAIKYMSKKEIDKLNQGIIVRGRVWGCSDSLRNLKLFDTSEKPKLIESLYSLSKRGVIFNCEDSYYSLFKIDVKSFLFKNFKDIYFDYVDYYRLMYSNLYHKQLSCQFNVEPDSETVKLSKPIPLIYNQLKLFDIPISRTLHYSD